MTLLPVLTINTIKIKQAITKLNKTWTNKAKLNKNIYTSPGTLKKNAAKIWITVFAWAQ